MIPPDEFFELPYMQIKSLRSKDTFNYSRVRAEMYTKARQNLTSILLKATPKELIAIRAKNIPIITNLLVELKL